MERTPLDKLLSAAMREVGYRRIESFIYCAEWSTVDVEHFVFFSMYGSPTDYLAADFGVRNQEAQNFALEEVRIYGGDIYQLMDANRNSRCPMRFSLGHVASWGIRSSLRISTISDQVLIAKLRDDIESRLLPIIRTITSADRLLSFLVDDAESHPWVRCNGAIRASIIIYLAVRQGISEAKLQSVLKPFYERIAASLLNASDPNPELYVKKVIEDAVAIGRRLVN
jgi:hypothetical protein